MTRLKEYLRGSSLGQLRFCDTDEAVLGADVEGAALGGQGGDVEGGEAGSDLGPALGGAGVDPQALVKRAGEDVGRGGEHGVGVDDHVAGGEVHGREVTGSVETHDACAVGSDHVTAVGWKRSGDPVVAQAGV